MEPLARIFRLNAVSCLGFGGAFVIWPGSIAAWLGTIPAGVLMAVGGVLLLNGVHLMLASGRKSVPAWEAIWFSLGDFAWWCGTAFLLASGLWVTTRAGQVSAGVVATVVATLGLAQIWALGLRRRGTSGRDDLRAIARSWLSLPIWVKLWLGALNLVFLAALFQPADLTRVVLVAYVASLPLLLAPILAAGGLTRATGVGHLVPWLPLWGWLFGQQGLYAVVLALVLGICLAFDFYDLLRWSRGERAVLGGSG